MRILPLAVLVALAGALPAAAVTFTETDDAGDTVSNPIFVGEGVDRIEGSNAAPPGGPADPGDIYLLALSGTPRLTITVPDTNTFVVGAALYLFNNAGIGVQADGSSIVGADPFGPTTLEVADLSPGFYFLAITDAFSPGAEDREGDRWFPGTRSSPPAAFDIFTGFADDGPRDIPVGDYVIEISAPPPPDPTTIPLPASGAALVAALGLLRLARRG